MASSLETYRNRWEQATRELAARFPLWIEDALAPTGASNCVSMHPDYDQIERDVVRAPAVRFESLILLNRSTPSSDTGGRRGRQYSYAGDQSWPDMETFRRDLSRVVHSVFAPRQQAAASAPSSCRTLWYYQGFHDIATVVLVVFGPGYMDSASNVLRVLAHVHLREFMAPTMEPVVQILDQIYPILERNARLPESTLCLNCLHELHPRPMFALPWLLTWFSHHVEDFETTLLLFDALICSHPLLAIYMCAATIDIFRSQIRTEILDLRGWTPPSSSALAFFSRSRSACNLAVRTDDLPDSAVVHHAMQKLPASVEFQRKAFLVIRRAQRWMQNVRERRHLQASIRLSRSDSVFSSEDLNEFCESSSPSSSMHLATTLAALEEDTMVADEVEVEFPSRLVNSKSQQDEPALPAIEAASTSWSLVTLYVVAAVASLVILFRHSRE